MPASFQEILNSRSFKFIVGENVNDKPTEFLVHEEAIAQLSKPLDTMMKGGMAESQAGCTIWADVSKETFERFAQFAYTGDYSIPKGGKRNRVDTHKEVMTDDSSRSPSPSPLHNLRMGWGRTEAGPVLAVQVPSPGSELGLVEEAVPGPASHRRINQKESVELKPEAGYGYYASKKDKKNKLKSGKGFFSSIGDSRRPASDPDSEPGTIPTPRRDKYPKLHSRVHSEDFNSLAFPLLAPRNNHDKTCEPAEHFDPDQSYAEILLGHASLYILGDLHLIDSLKALALFKLHKTLRVFQLGDGNVEDIIALARYAYSEEGGGGGLDEGIGGLRGLVCQYMATHAVVLSFNEGFMDLLADGGQLVKDFFKYEVQRIS